MATNVRKFKFNSNDRQDSSNSKQIPSTSSKAISPNFNSQNPNHLFNGSNEIKTDYKTSRLNDELMSLRQYLSNNKTLQKSVIRAIFKWQDDELDDQTGRDSLKKYSKDVKNTLKEFNQIKMIQQNADINKLKLENSLLKNMTKKQKIQNQSDQNMNLKANKKEQIGKQQNESHLDNDLLLYFKSYINLKVRDNEEKFNQLNKHLSSLINKIQILESKQRQLEHLKFQREVKIQESVRRSTQVIIKNIPLSIGDDGQQPIEGRQTKGVIVRQANDSEVDKYELELTNMKQKIEELQLLSNNLRREYEGEIESHTKTYAELEQIFNIKQLYAARNKQLEQNIERLNKKIGLSQTKINELQNYIITLTKQNKKLRSVKLEQVGLSKDELEKQTYKTKESIQQIRRQLLDSMNIFASKYKNQRSEASKNKNSFPTEGFNISAKIRDMIWIQNRQKSSNEDQSWQRLRSSVESISQKLLNIELTYLQI